MARSNLLLVLLLLSCCVEMVPSARILGLFPIPAHSHFIGGLRLFKELAAKGHQVTMVSSFEGHAGENYTELVLTGMVEVMTAVKKEFFAMNDMFTIEQSMVIYDMANILTNYTLGHPNIQQLLKSQQTFDVVILDMFPTEGLLAISHHFNAPTIVLCSMGSHYWNNNYNNNPAPISYVPHKFLPYVGSMNFWQRLNNFIVSLEESFVRHYYSLQVQDEMVQNYLPGYPSVYEMMRKDTFFLLNSHVSSNTPVPLSVNMVEIGGFHVKAGNKIPSDIQKFLDESKNGVILFAMGSNLKTSELKPWQKAALLNTFRKLKQNVLWKWEEESMPGKPDNVKLAKWLPQPDVLAHPNCVAFITHAGLLSTIEAVVFGIPVVGIPVFADQAMNSHLIESMGFAVTVPLSELNEEKLTKALHEVLYNPSYRENAKLRSRIMNDRPMKPMDTAIYWVEYVIRNRGQSYYTNHSLELNYFQRELLDVYLFILITFYAVFKFLQFILRRLQVTNSKTKLKGE